jgi:hypothetical protein
MSTFKPGQQVKCTVESLPRTADQTMTIERLMRRDATAKRALKKGHRRRQQEMVVYNRGNRDWYKREKCGKIVRVAQGATWTMPYTLDIASDIAAVQSFIKIEAA